MLKYLKYAGSRNRIIYLQLYTHWSLTSQNNLYDHANSFRPSDNSSIMNSTFFSLKQNTLIPPLLCHAGAVYQITCHNHVSLLPSEQSNLQYNHTHLFFPSSPEFYFLVAKLL